MVDQYRGKSLGNADARREDVTMEESDAGGLLLSAAGSKDSLNLRRTVRCLERSNPAAFMFTGLPEAGAVGLYSEEINSRPHSGTPSPNRTPTGVPYTILWSLH